LAEHQEYAQLYFALHAFTFAKLMDPTMKAAASASKDSTYDPVVAAKALFLLTKDTAALVDLPLGAASTEMKYLDLFGPYLFSLCQQRVQLNKETAFRAQVSYSLFRF
jgi:hypothetical protein